MRVAVIGVGNIGSAVAARLLDTGAAVTLHSRRRVSCAPFVERGARVADTPAEAAAAADFVVTCLNGADIVRDVVFGPAGVALAASPAKLLVDLSSIDPSSTSSLARHLRGATGMGWVDAPLSGGAPAALRGELVLMVGGEDEDVARARPLFARIARRATHLGPSGAGQTVKLVNQILCASGLLAVAEAVHFAERAGVDAARIPEALAGGRADSRLLQEFMAKFARRDFSPTGRIGNMLKDLEAVASVAAAHDAQLPVTRRVTELNRLLVDAGFGDADNTAYMSLFGLMGSAAPGEAAPAPAASRHAVIVMGPSGCGKTTLGSALADRLGWRFVEGDALHPPANVEKMRAGVPLTDADREPFLEAVAATIRGAGGSGIVISCSALKRRYRDLIRARAGPVLFVLPVVPRELLQARVGRRVDHFMPPSLVDSQLQDLERPGADEEALRVPGEQPVEDQVAAVVAALRGPQGRTSA